MRNLYQTETEMLMPVKETQIQSAPSANQKIRRDERQEPSCCDQCKGKSGLITAERAATLCQCSRRKIYHWIEEGHLHFVELVDGTVLVCGRTLAKKIEELSTNTDKLNCH